MATMTIASSCSSDVTNLIAKKIKELDLRKRSNKFN